MQEESKSVKGTVSFDISVDGRILQCPGNGVPCGFKTPSEQDSNLGC